MLCEARGKRRYPLPQMVASAATDRATLRWIRRTGYHNGDTTVTRHRVPNFLVDRLAEADCPHGRRLASPLDESPWAVPGARGGGLPASRITICKWVLLFIVPGAIYCPSVVSGTGTVFPPARCTRSHAGLLLAYRRPRCESSHQQMPAMRREAIHLPLQVEKLPNLAARTPAPHAKLPALFRSRNDETPDRCADKMVSQLAPVLAL